MEYYQQQQQQPTTDANDDLHLSLLQLIIPLIYHQNDTQKHKHIDKL